MMEALAELYWEQGKFAESSRVYRKVISQNMDSPRICEWQNKIVRNTLSQGSKRDQVQEIQRLGAVYDRVADMKAIKKDQLEECKVVVPRHVEGAGAHLAQGSAEDQEPRHLRAGDAGLQGLPGALPRRQGVLRDGVLLRRDPVDRRRAGQGQLEGRRRAVHQGRRAQSQGQVREGGGVRLGARVEERAERRRPRAEGSRSRRTARPSTARRAASSRR